MRILIPALSLLVAFGAACSTSSDPQEADCSELTYQNFGEPFMADYCLACHSSSAGNRMGAPSAVNLDTHQEVQERALRINARAGLGATMPPINGPTEQERADLAAWIDCGAP